jgi:DNA-binding SARP family transcriptional activator
MNNIGQQQKQARKQPHQFLISARKLLARNGCMSHSLARYASALGVWRLSYSSNLTFLTRRKKAMQLEQDISLSCRFRVCLHGLLEVWKRNADGTWELVEKEEWGKGRPTRSVFKRLLAQPARRLSRGRLQEDIWPAIDFELADKYLYNAMSVIRGVIGKDLVKTWESVYELADQSLIWVDIDACEMLLKTAEDLGCTSVQALLLLEQALSYLERGDFLEGESGVWCYGLRKKSEDMLRQARLWLAEGYEAQGKIWQSSQHYRALLQTVPPDEEALQHWLEMLHRHSKQQEALKCYEDIKSLMEAQGFTLSPAMEQFVTSLIEEPKVETLTFTSITDQIAVRLYSSSEEILRGIMDVGQLSGDFVNRRELFQKAGVLLFPFLFTPGTRLLSAGLDEFVSGSASTIKACWYLMKGKEIASAEKLLNAYAPALLAITFQASPYQHTIAQTATQSCMIRAIIAKHHLNPIAREMYCHEAIQCSRLANDKALHAAALMYLGYTYTFCSPLRPKKAIEIFLEALRELGKEDALVKSDICIGLADAYALVNDAAQAQRTIHLAQDCFPAHSEQSSSFLYADCALDTLYQWEAKMYLDLAQHDQQQEYCKRAWDILLQSTKIQAVSERCMIETVIYQTSAALGLGDLDVYASYLKNGVSTALQIGSQRRYQEAFDLYQQAPETWKQEQQMRDLTAFFQEQHRQEKQA